MKLGFSMFLGLLVAGWTPQLLGQAGPGEAQAAIDLAEDGESAALSERAVEAAKHTTAVTGYSECLNYYNTVYIPENGTNPDVEAELADAVDALADRNVEYDIAEAELANGDTDLAAAYVHFGLFEWQETVVDANSANIAFSIAEFSYTLATSHSQSALDHIAEAWVLMLLGGIGG